jgi:hypothetical protein
MINDLTLTEVLCNALSAISKSNLFPEEAGLDSKGVVHSKLSSEFIKQLHELLEPYFSGENQHVLSRTKKAKFTNRSEFLFDVIAVKTKMSTSPFSSREVEVISDSLLQIESEFALDFNQAMIDFSKLLCGLAPIKVMIMPFFKNDQTINKWLQENIFTEERRKTDKAKYYLAYIKHPKHWISNEVCYFELYECIAEEIVKVAPTKNLDA